MPCVALQAAANSHDLQGALSALFREPREALALNFVVSPAQCHNLDQKMLELEGILDLLEQQPYAGSPAVRWGPANVDTVVMQSVMVHAVISAAG
jgi:hypothetical protein